MVGLRQMRPPIPLGAGLGTRRWLACISCLGVLLAFAGCGSDDRGNSNGSGEPVPFRPSSSGPTAFGEIPWPSDLYINDAGVIGEVPGLERVAAAAGKIADGLRQLDGFGRSTGALFFVGSAVDGDRLPRTWEAATATDAGVFIVDVDDASPALGARYPCYAKYLPTLDCIAVIPVPGIVLPAGVRHAAVLTRRVLLADGVPLVADTELERIASSRQRTTRAELLYGDAIDRLVDSGAVRRASDIAGLAVFTTSRRALELPLLRDELRELPEPSLILDPVEAAPYTVAVFGIGGEPSLDAWLGAPDRDENGDEWPGGDNVGGIAHDQIAVVASGAFVAPSYLNRGTRRFDRDPDSGAILLVDANTRVPVTLVIPARPAPPQGYPVVIHGHGLSNHRGSMLGVANELARAGFAMIGIDDVLHGTRLSSTKDQINNYPGSYVGPDGIPDATPFPVAFFAGFNDFVSMTDNFRQTVLDQSSLVRLIQSSALDLSPLAAAAGGATPRLDPTRIYWSGGSLGGILGAMTIAVEPEIDAAALQVPGAAFLQLIATSSAELSSLVTGLAEVTLGVQGDEEIDEFHPVALLLAAVTEPGDPISYAPHVLHDPLLPDRTPPDILVTYAAYDEVLPNIATVALIRAFDIPLASPNLFDLPGIANVDAPVVANLPSGRTAAAVQYLPANHGLGYGRFDTRHFLPGPPTDGALRPRLAHEIRFEQPIREHLAQLVTFLETVAAREPARIEVTIPPRADYDGDGILDADERANGTDPYEPDR